MFPKVSVLMSVYNGEDYLKEAIESILNQTFSDFEFLIFDDASTDNSLAILKSYAQTDSRIKLTISDQNLGLQKALNRLLKQAQGIYVARMDADDISFPERFQLSVEFLEANLQVVCVGGNFELIDEKARLLTQLTVPQEDDLIQEKMLAGHTAMNHPTVMLRRFDLLKVGGYDESFIAAADLDLFLKLGEIGQLANLNQTLLQYRINPNSISSKKQSEQIKALRYACSRAWQRRGIQGTFEANQHWRPGRDRASRYQFALKYGWWAWNSGQRKTALIYAVKALRIKPWRKEGWKLLLCACFKYLS